MQPLRRLLPLFLILAALGLGTPPVRAQAVPEGRARELRWPFGDARATRHWPRSRSYDLQNLKAEVQLDWAKKEIAGVATLTLAPLNDGMARFSLDATEMTIEEVKLAPPAAGRADGKALTFVHQGDELAITLDRAYKAGEVFSVAIRYRAQPRKGLYFNAPDAAYPQKPQQVWSNGETDYLHYWIPLYDSPNDKTTTEILATVPADLFALSNGKLVAERDNHDGTRTFDWKESIPHSTYLITLVAGPFERFHQSLDGLDVDAYVPRGTDKATTERSFAWTPDMIRFFAGYIDLPYPWEKYSQITVEDFLWGGMENTTATTLTIDTLHGEAEEPNYSSEGLVAHELVHHWWGDLLTCRDWSHIWLNEGFATFFTNLWFEHRYGRDEYDYHRWQDAQSYFEEDREEYRRPIVWPVYVSAEDLFDSHTYPKGGLVLAMLRAQLGDALFQKALRHYAQKFARQPVDSEDLSKGVTEATGEELGWFFEQWLYRAGHPELHVEYTWDEETHSAHLRVEQRQALKELTPVFRLPLEVEFLTSKGPERVRVTLAEAKQDFNFPLAERPTRVRFDPDQVLLKTLEFPRSREELIDLLRNDSKVAGRLWAAEQLGRPGADLVSLAALREALLHDAFYGVRRELARVLGTTKSPVARDALIEALADTDARVRQQTAAALGEFSGDAPAAAALKRVIASEPKTYVVAAAVKALGKTRAEGAFEELRAALGRASHAEAIRRAALDGLAGLGDERGLALALEWSRYGKPARARESAIVAVGKLGRGKPDVLEALLPLLNDPYLWARRATITALGELGDTSALPALKAIIARESERRLSREAEKAAEKIRHAQKPAAAPSQP